MKIETKADGKTCVDIELTFDKDDFFEKDGIKEKFFLKTTIIPIKLVIKRLDDMCPHYNITDGCPFLCCKYPVYYCPLKDISINGGESVKQDSSPNTRVVKTTILNNAGQNRSNPELEASPIPNAEHYPDPEPFLINTSESLYDDPKPECPHWKVINMPPTNTSDKKIYGCTKEIKPECPHWNVVIIPETEICNEYYSGHCEIEVNEPKEVCSPKCKYYNGLEFYCHKGHNLNNFRGLTCKDYKPIKEKEPDNYDVHNNHLP